MSAISTTENVSTSRPGASASDIIGQGGRKKHHVEHRSRSSEHDESCPKLNKGLAASSSHVMTQEVVVPVAGLHPSTQTFGT